MKHRKHLMSILFAAMVMCTSWLGPALAPVCVEAWDDGLPEDLTNLDLEDLLGIKVTSVSKRVQKLSDAAAAIFVISREDIRRSGATSIPDVLRMVPGIEVARIDASKWAVTCRGFNGRFANKLLVLIDGRSIYVPLFSGVFWEAQDVMLEDVERIEVIRGPGASLWGANAVNGVINIITKSARDTQGGLVSTGGGTEERGFGSARYGSRLGEHTYGRVYARYFDRDNFQEASGQSAPDDWKSFRTGFRIDHASIPDDTLVFQGDFFRTDAGAAYYFPDFAPPYQTRIHEEGRFDGGDAILRWSHAFSESSDMVLQTYYNHDGLDDIVLGERRDTFDMDFQHQFRLLPDHRIIWGLGYRFTSSRTRSSAIVDLDPDNRQDHLLSAFVQDEIDLISDRLRMIAGSKFEHNDYTGFEVQPTLRLLWTPYSRHSLWVAVSRAVRTPSQAQSDIRFIQAILPPDPFSRLPALVRVEGNSDVLSEELTAFELGHRFQITDRLSMDATAFYNIYDNLGTNEMTGVTLEPDPVPHWVVPLQSANRMSGDTHGLELSIEWQASRWWKLLAAYTYLDLRLEADENSSDTFTERIVEAGSPGHQFSLRSWTSLPYNLELDLWLRFVNELPALDIPGYVTLDARLGWRPRKDMEISIVGRNLIEKDHVEFRSDFLNTPLTAVQRGVYARVLWNF